MQFESDISYGIFFEFFEFLGDEVFEFFLGFFYFILILKLIAFALKFAEHFFDVVVGDVGLFFVLFSQQIV